MDRKELIEALQQHQLQLRGLEQTNKDLMKQILEFVDDLHEINNGDLSKRLKVDACIMGHFADCINSVVEDLHKTMEFLPQQHLLRKKYLFYSVEEEENL